MSVIFAMFEIVHGLHLPMVSIPLPLLGLMRYQHEKRHTIHDAENGQESLGELDGVAVANVAAGDSLMDIVEVCYSVVAHKQNAHLEDVHSAVDVYNNVVDHMQHAHLEDIHSAVEVYCSVVDHMKHAHLEDVQSAVSDCTLVDVRVHALFDLALSQNSVHRTLATFDHVRTM
eukprot:13064778-Ditylum_brightwellii.AAC.1